MKRIYLFALVGALMVAFTACEKKEEPQPRPESFPKKQLIEEFTGQACGWCPGGMNAVHDFVKNDTNWIIVLHHTYGTDHFTANGSSTISNKVGVSGVPSITINREKTEYGSYNDLVFSPYDLPDANISQFATTTYASVNIKNTYDASSRVLKVDVSGMVLKSDSTARYLTVLVKESGMIDTQEDYKYSFDGWQEFRHTNAARAFLTKAVGNKISTNQDGEYAASFEVTLKDKWVAENCMVVAFLAEDFKPVVQANQRPVVAGTTGGADILHGGITPVPVTDYYPEPGANKSTKDYSGLDTDTLNKADAWGFVDNELNAIEWQVQTYNKSAKFKINGSNHIPFAWLYVYTDVNATSLTEGTYPINNSRQPGTVWAGYRDDAQQQIGGGIFYYTNLSYFNQNTIYPGAEWLIVDGTMTITANGFALDGHARNGTEIHLLDTTAIVNKGIQSMPRRGKKMQNNLHISENNSTFAGRLCSIE